MKTKIGFWKTKESHCAEVYFKDNIMADQATGESGNLIIAQNGDVFEFLY